VLLPTGVAHKFTTDSIRPSLFFIFTAIIGIWCLLVVQNVERIVLVQYVCEKFVVQVSSQLSWQGIVRLIQAESLLVGMSATLVKPQPGNKEQKVKECFAVTN